MMVVTCDFLNLKLLISFLLLVIVCNGQNLSLHLQDDECVTPTATIGKCIHARTCPHMEKALLTVKRPLSENASKLLESYICEETEDGYKVCCPSTTIIFPDDDIKPDNLVPVLSRHANYPLLPVDCGYNDFSVSFKIIDGEDADLREYPWMALLRYKKSDILCSGSIINNRYILTAAHCLPSSHIPFGVRVGEYDISKEKDCKDVDCNEAVQDVVIEEVIVHPDYVNTTKVNDIGLLRVTPIKLNTKNIRPICLPREKNKEITATTVEISGWGILHNFAGSTSKILQRANIPIVNHTKCRDTFQNVNANMICAGGGNNTATACSGDSGGPMQVPEIIGNEKRARYFQYGIVSFGLNHCNAATVFTKVAKYMDWILDNIKP